MTDLQKLRQWLLTYPDWDADGALHVDYTDAAPVNCGLYPTGLEELSRQTDVLGNVTARCRYHFALYRVAARQEDNAANAAWLLNFQTWVQEQSIRHLAPTFGNDPATERLRAQKGRLKEESQTGTATYVVSLIADFTKVYSA